jgi:lipopolysaccharide/colanic/teichoic acid biosynthesis glycosyltransferase
VNPVYKDTVYSSPGTASGPREAGACLSECAGRERSTAGRGPVREKRIPRLPARESRRSHEGLRRTADAAVSALVLGLLAPLLLVVALVIRLDSAGPILFRQRRTGLHGRPFIMYKFRTMRAGAEEEREQLRGRSKLYRPDFKIEDDPRNTRVGSFLRRWSVDEIPNLLNVLRGEMSLVGPRPTSWGVEDYEDWHVPRLAVRPGVTGLWQVMGRGDVDLPERMRLDLRYISERSWRLDWWILCRTLRAVLSRRGAY